MVAAGVGVWLGGGLETRVNTKEYYETFTVGPLEIKFLSATAVFEDNSWLLLVQADVRNVTTRSAAIQLFEAQLALPSSIPPPQAGGTRYGRVEFVGPMSRGVFVGAVEKDGNRRQVPPTGDWMLVRWLYQLPPDEPLQDFEVAILGIAPLDLVDPSFLQMADIYLWAQVEQGTHQFVTIPLDFE
jgi:hypothetical protein